MDQAGRKYKESWGGEYGANKDAQSGIRMGDSAMNRGGRLPCDNAQLGSVGAVGI